MEQLWVDSLYCLVVVFEGRHFILILCSAVVAKGCLWATACGKGVFCCDSHDIIVTTKKHEYWMKEK
jgi:hypothetical protein